MPFLQGCSARSLEVILVYTGNGKGKTSACVGQAVRALGQNMTVAFGQFMKRDGQAGEQRMLAQWLGPRFLAGGEGFLRREEDRPAHRAAALRVLPSQVEARINFGSWQLPPVFHWLKNAGELSWPEILQIFNGGIGYVLILPAEQAEEAINRIQAFNLRAWRIGEIARRAQDGEQVVVNF